MNRISARTLKSQLLDGDEIALLDAREELAFGAAHILYASCLPLSRLELKARAMVPRRSARVVVCDGGEGLAERAAARLEHFGYTDVSVLEGGMEAWRAAGFEVFSGVNVPSKAFGEIVEHEFGTPSYSADELEAKLDAGENLVILDSRPWVEYHARSIPRGVCCPGAELAYRVHDLAPDPDTTVVVNCAGRTRSIIGAQSLINAGIPNRVAALRNGTMGWHLAGHEVATGAADRAPEPTADGLARARAAAARVAERFGVQTIDRTGLERWRAEAGVRTLYVIDVRHPEEYLAGHLPGTRHVAGGQLVQETDHTLATQRARVVLVDDTGVRAIMTASWLVQMGWEDVRVLAGGIGDEPLEPGAEPVEVLGLDEADPDTVVADDLRERLDAGAVTVVDVSLSRAFRAGHVPGARWVVRARLDRVLPKLELADEVVLTSEDGTLARLAAAEAGVAAGVRRVRVLHGGNAAWRDAGHALEAGDVGISDRVDDVWLRPYEKDWGVEDAMQAYLEWEVALVPQIARDGTARFRVPEHR